MPAPQFDVNLPAQLSAMCYSVSCMVFCFFSNQKFLLFSRVWVCLNPGLHYLICRDTELLLAQLSEAFTRDFKPSGSTWSIITTVRVAWIRVSFTGRVWRMLCVAFKYLTRQSCTFLSNSQKMSAAYFVNLSVFLHNVQLRSENRTGGVSTVLLFSCFCSHHCIKKKWAYSKTIHWFWDGIYAFYF